MTKRVWKALGLAMVALLLVTGAATSAVAQPPAPESTNTLRVYGHEDENANFPYVDYQAPFDLTHPEAPPKDFIQWNPAYMFHMDQASNGVYGGFFGELTASDGNMNEKVHLRQWYTPVYTEPSGIVWANQEGVPTADIVKEYTYILLDPSTNDPIAGLPGTTRMAFPIADNDDLKPGLFNSQVGLDDYDVDNDGAADVAQVETLAVNAMWPNDPCPECNQAIPATATWMDLSSGGFTVEVGDEVRFLDHRIVVKDIVPTWGSNPGVQLDVFYQGERDDSMARNELATDLIVPYEETLSAGRHNVHVEMLTNSPPNPVSRSDEFINNNSFLSLVSEPWYLQVRSVGGSSAEIVVGRLLTEGESFFVDGAEYELAKIYWPDVNRDFDFGMLEQVSEPLGKCDNTPGPQTFEVDVPNPDLTYFADCNGDGDVDGNDVTVHLDGVATSAVSIDQATGEVVVEDCCCSYDVTVDYCFMSPKLKYVTVRNSLPKFDRVYLKDLSVWKEAVQPEEPLPLLPPFNMEHDVIDDVNIPELGRGMDLQYPDNRDESETCGFVFPPGSGLMWGCQSGIHELFNTIEERRVEDQDPAVEFFVEEAKEQRFDTNLLEEKFTTGDGLDDAWQWINIETMPWHYTEFVLPEIDDAPAGISGYDSGDYILVSSFITEDSDDVWETWETTTDPEANKDPDKAVRVKFAFDSALGMVDSADLYVNDADYNSEHREVAENSLRVYGYEDENAPNDYGDQTAPFDLTHPMAPPKDFIQWNPAYHSHLEGVVVSGQDGNEKVHLRQWYVPDYEEPAGDVWLTDPDVQESPDIVKEYTYVLLDADNNPLEGQPSTTDFFFPVADNTDQIGIDSYDFDDDGTDDLVHLEAQADEELSISTGRYTIREGDTIRFLDHAIEITEIDSMTPGPRVSGKVYYLGNSNDQALPGLLTVEQGDVGSAGRHSTANAAPVALTSPWYMRVESVLANDTANVRIGRILRESESFFVDGAEYLVAEIENGAGLEYITLRNALPKYDQVYIPNLSIYKTPVQAEEDLPFLPPFNQEHTMVDDINIPVIRPAGGPDVQVLDNVVGEAETCGTEFPPGSGLFYGCQSFIHELFNTIDERLIPNVPAIKEYFIAEELEPRFNTNLLEEKFYEFASGDPFLRTYTVWWEDLERTGWEEYEGYWYGPVDMPNEDGSFFADCNGDGVVDEWDVWVTVDDVTVPVIALSDNIPGELPGYVLLEQDYGPEADVEIQYCYEETYDPADSRAQLWEWINIETWPMHYTEFVLPELPDKPQEYGLDVTGDYILVSSWMTEDSTDVWANDADDAVRMKFVYDAEDGTGIYVNSYAPSLECYDFNGDGVVDILDLQAAADHWNTELGDADYDATFDVNGDDKINVIDLQMIANQFGQTCP